MLEGKVNAFPFFQYLERFDIRLIYIPSLILLALAFLTGNLGKGLISTVNMTLLKEEKSSTFRQTRKSRRHCAKVDISR